jgi:hypothetical protein
MRPWLQEALKSEVNREKYDAGVALAAASVENTRLSTVNITLTDDLEDARARAQTSSRAGPYTRALFHFVSSGRTRYS